MITTITTTAMMIWLFKQLGTPVSYNVGGKLSFGGMGEFDPKSDYFVYECHDKLALALALTSIKF